MTVRVGNVIGSGEHERLRKVVLGGVMYVGLFATLSMLVFFLAGYELSLFVIEDTEVIAMAIKLLIVAGLFQFVDGFQVMVSASLRGMGDVKKPALYSMIGYWFIAFPLGVYMSLYTDIGAVGMWTALAVGLTFCAFLMGGRLYKAIWRGGLTGG